MSYSTAVMYLNEYRGNFYASSHYEESKHSCVLCMSTCCLCGVCVACLRNYSRKKFL